MTSKVIFQTLPVNLDDLPDMFGDRVCSKCGEKTFVYEGKPQWRHSNITGNLLCKRHYDEEYRNAVKKKEINIGKLKLNKKKDELTFDKKPVSKLRHKGLVKEKKLDLDERQQSIINQLKSVPIISHVSAMRRGEVLDICCNLCWSPYTLIEFQVSLRTDRKRITVRICHTCLKNMYKMLSSVRDEGDNSDKINIATNSRDEYEARHLQMHDINPYKIMEDMMCDF